MKRTKLDRRGLDSVAGIEADIRPLADRRLAACWNACVGVSIERLEMLRPGDIAKILGPDEKIE